MPDEPQLVSIIIPVYAVETYLQDCLDSVLAQTHTDIDVVLVDDGSPDRCGIICDDYARLDPRVRVFHQENRGLSAARNVGIENSHGQWLTFVDSDDMVHPNLVEHLLRVQEVSGADLAACSFEKFNDGDNVKAAWRAEARGQSVDARVFSSQAALEQMVGPLNGNLVVSWAKLYRVRLFSDIRFPEGRFHEDEFTTHRLLGEADKVAISTARLYLYRQRSGSIMTSSSDSHKRRDKRAALRDQALFLYSRGLHGAATGIFRRLYMRWRQDWVVSTREKDAHKQEKLLEELIVLSDLMRQTGQPLGLYWRAKLWITIARVKISKSK